MRTINYIDPMFGPPVTEDKLLQHKKVDRTKTIKTSHDGNLYVEKATGATVTDIYGNEFIDFYHSQGAHILGHAPAKVLDAIKGTLDNGVSQGMPTPADTLLAESILKAMPFIDEVRLVNSGSIAVMAAVRLARAFTGRDKVVRFEGALHGSSEQFLGTSVTGLESIGIASAKGIPMEYTQHTINLPFNTPEAVLEAFETYHDDIAAIIVEPVPTESGVVLPQREFLRFLRNISLDHQSLLIFDEITTGFRSKISGAQGYFGIKPDLTVLGKIIGGGFPMGAFGGRRDIVSLFPAIDPVDAAGPIAVTAGLASLNRLNSPLFYEVLNHKSRDFIYWLKEITHEKGVVVNSFQSMFSLYFSEKPVTNHDDVVASDTAKYDKFRKILLEHGIFLSPSPQGANFVSIAHLPEQLNRALEVIHGALKGM